MPRRCELGREFGGKVLLENERDLHFARMGRRKHGMKLRADCSNRSLTDLGHWSKYYPFLSLHVMPAVTFSKKERFSRSFDAAALRGMLALAACGSLVK